MQFASHGSIYSSLFNMWSSVKNNTLLTKNEPIDSVAESNTGSAFASFESWKVFFLASLSIALCSFWF